MLYTQPERLAMVAKLFGMTAPSIETCRVLELGCCDGSNIIAIARDLPKAHCWGVDLSAQHIAKGQSFIEELELKNITLRQMNILEVNKHFGTFDYIIAHGIYSWVSSEVQEKILSICKHHLASNGVAYVSYDTKPGWNLNRTFRDMMLYHTDSKLSNRSLENLLEFFIDAAANHQDSYSQYISKALNQFNQLPESFLFKTLLKEENEPLYFYQFMERAHQHGLDYLGDVFLHTMIPSASVAEPLQYLTNDLIYQEQMMDFLCNRHFRHTLLCHEGTVLNRSLSPEKIKSCSSYHVPKS